MPNTYYNQASAQRVKGVKSSKFIFSTSVLLLTLFFHVILSFDIQPYCLCYWINLSFLTCLPKNCAGCKSKQNKLILLRRKTQRIYIIMQINTFFRCQLGFLGICYCRCERLKWTRSWSVKIGCVNILVLRWARMQSNSLWKFK